MAYRGFERPTLWLTTHRMEWRLAVRLTCGVLATYAAAKLLGVPQVSWAVLTAVIVTQASLGGSLKAIADRLLGTLGGAVYGGAVAFLLPHQDAVSLGVALLVAIAPLAVLTALNPGFRVAPITAVIVLLAPSGLTAGPIGAAADRFMEIMLGCVVGLGSALFVFPARARSLVGEAAAETLDLLAALLPVALMADGGETRTRELTRLQDAVRKTLTRLEAIAGEAVHERRIYRTDDFDPSPILRTVLRLRHDVVMIARALGVVRADFPIARLEPVLGELSGTIAGFLRLTAAAFRDDGPRPPLDPVRRAAGRLDDEIAAMRKEGATRGLSDDSVESIFTLSLAFQQLGGHLGDLSERAEEWQRTRHLRRR